MASAIEGLVLRTPTRVAQRAGCVLCVAGRQGLETRSNANSAFPLELVQQSCTAFSSIINHPFLSNEATKKEKRLLTKKPGTWSSRDVSRQEMRWESLGILEWALKGTGQPMTPFDEHFDRQRLIGVLCSGGLEALPSQLQSLSQVGLQSPEDVLKALRQAQVWHWRAHMQVLHPANVVSDEDGKPLPQGCHDLEDYNAKIKEGAENALRKGEISSMVDDDFGVLDNHAYRDVDPPTMAALASISQARLLTLNWIAGLFDWLE